MSNAQESPPNDGITADYATLSNKLLNSIEKKIQKYDLTNAESFLTFWSETNDAVFTYDYLLSSSVNPPVIFCVVALESPIVGKVFITDASATVKETATRLASVKAVKYLLKANLITSEDVKSIDLDLPEYDSDVLDNLQKIMFASTNNENRSNPVANFSLNQEKSVDRGKSMINRNENGKLEQNHIDVLVETRSSKSITLETFPEKDRESANNVMESQESSSFAVRPEKSRNLDPQEKEKIFTENMQNIVVNGGDCNYSSYKDATSFLRNWCDRNNIVALFECAYIKAGSVMGFVCSLALSSSTGNLLLTESASPTEEGACLFASKKAVSYLVDNGKVTLDEIGHINLHVPKVEAVILRKLQNSQKAEQFEEQKIEEVVESPMSSDSEGTSDEDSDSDSNIREKAVGDDQNGGSDHEQNYIEEVDEMEAHSPISSEDILDKNADTTKLVLESQNESSKAVINGDSQEHSQENPSQNSTIYPASKNQSNKKIVLSDWCLQNNVHLAVDYVATIHIGHSRIELCTVTLKWTTNDKLFSTGAVGNTSKIAKRLAMKKALIHLMSEGLVMPDEINGIDLNTNKRDKSTNGKVKQFLSDKANKAKSSLSSDLIHRLEESVSSFPINQENEKSQLEEWCSAHWLKMEISTSKIVEAKFECKVMVEPYDYVGSGKGRKVPSIRRACLDFINHLQEDDKPEASDDPIIVLREWCKDRKLKLQMKHEKTDPAKHQSRVKVESFSFFGVGIGPDVQSTENLACRRFIDRLRAEKLFPKDETEESEQSEIVTEDAVETTNSTSLAQRPSLLRDLVQRSCPNNYRRVVHNKPDILVLDQLEKKAYIIDIAVPSDENAQKTRGEKLRKYQELSFELKEIYRLNRESNIKSKQNEENTRDVAESRTSLPLANEFPESTQCEDSGSDIDPFEEQDETEECAQHEKLSEAAEESRTSTPLSQCCSENISCEDSGSSIVFMDEDEEESNKKSEQNEENTRDVAESRTSLPLPNEFPESTQCEDSGRDIDPLEEQVSSSEDGSDADLSERSQNSSQQQSDESFLAFKQEIIKNRSLGSGVEITSLRDWCQQNNVAFTFNHHHERTSVTKHKNKVVWFCTLTLSSPTVGEFCSFSAPGRKRKTSEPLVTKFAFNYLVQEEFITRDQIKSHNIDVSPMEARVLKKLEFTPHITSRYYKKGSKIDFKLQENKKKTSDSAVSYKPAKSNPKAVLKDWCMKNGLTVKYECRALNHNEYLYQVKVPPHEYIGTGNGSNNIAKQRACQDFINHLPKECKSQVSRNKNASKALSNWCSMQGLEMDCKRTKTVPRKIECVVRVQSFDFVGTGIERKRKDAQDTAAQDFLDRLIVEGIRPESYEAVNDGCDSDVEILEEKDEMEECVQHEKLSEAADESRTSTPPSQCCSENISCEDSDSSIVFMDEDEEESNKKSEQNEENTRDVAESRTSLPLPNEFPESTQCEDSGSDIDPLEEQVSSSEDGSDADLSERSQNSSQQQSDESFLAFKQEIIKNRSLGSGVEITSLRDWCQQNNVAFTFKHHFGRKQANNLKLATSGTKRNVWFCTLTLSSPTVGEFCSLSAPGSKRKACEPLVTKFAFNYLVQEEFVMRDQIKSHNIDVSPMEARILKKLQFTPHITSRYYKKGSKIDFKLQENKKKTSASAVSYTPAKSKPKAVLDDWCIKNGLTVKYECRALNLAGYHIQVKVPPHEYIGTGNGSSGVAKQRACQDFINHLPKECKSQVSGNQKASVALRDWCTMQGLEMFCNRTKTVPRKTECVVRVQSFDFVGSGIERKKKDAQDIAAQDFLDRLMAEGMRQESHEAVDDGCDSDVEILEEKVHLNEGANILPKIDLSSIGHLFKKKANSSQCIDVTSNYWIGSAEARLQQFFDENNINAQYTLSTDPDCSEGCHVASMQFYIRRIGKSFSASSNGSTVTEAKTKCASLLLKQLILANLYDGLKQRKAIAPIKEPIELDVPDDLVQSIIQLCTEFDVNTPELIPVEKSTGPILMSSHYTNCGNANSNSGDTLHFEHGDARMNWNPWDVTEIRKNQRFHNMSLSDISKKLRTSQRDRSQRRAFKNSMREREKLPIYKHERKILKCIKDNAVTILKGSTGSGKSTQVCQYILDYAIESNKGAYCNIVVIEPKRICASTLAERVAFERYEFLGQSVGYAVRFDSIPPRPYGSILFCTPGYFLRRVENGLVGVSHIIVDEIHERGLETDYILMMLRMMLKSCSSLKVVLMSADVNIDLFSSYFDGCAHITVHGNCYPVKEYFLEDCIELIKFKFNDPYGEIYAEEDSDACSSFGQSKEDVSKCGVLDSSAYSTQTLQTLACYDEQAISSELIEAIIVWTREQNINGSILVFLPGWGDISKASEHLSRSINSANYCVLPLHSKIKGPEQKQVFLPVPPGKTKVILSTSLAESSVTIDDVICVIDSCKSRISISQDNLSFKFVSEWASKVNLNQRSGRAGRLRPGFCFRLCTKARYEELPMDIEPQMSRAPLYSLVLSLKLMKMGNIRDVLNSTLEPPPLRSIEEAERLLSELQCLDSRMELTPLGEMLGRLPLDPRVGRMLLMSTLFECPSQILKIAAYASVQEELFDKPSEDMKMVGKQRCSDHIAVLHVLSSGENFSKFQEYYQINSLNLLDDIFRIEEQLFTRLCRFGFDVPSIYGSMDDKLDIVTGLLCQAFYPNVCAVNPKLKKRVFQPNGKFGLISSRSLIGYSDVDFNPPSPIFIFGEQTETSINVCRNLTMVSPIHLLCFTNCKVVYENGVVKIDDWLPLKMDPDAAAAIMCVRQMIEKALHHVVSHPSAARKAVHQRLATVVKQLCQTDFDL